MTSPDRGPFPDDTLLGVGEPPPDPYGEMPPPDDELPPSPEDEPLPDPPSGRGIAGSLASPSAPRGGAAPEWAEIGRAGRLEGAALDEAALTALRALTGREDAAFHPGQFEAIEAVVRDRRRVLVVQRTGWGKSAVYFIASLLARRGGGGPALIVSPLLALMRDQVTAAQRAGVRAVAISSANPTEWDEIEDRLAANDVDVLLVSPERLVNPRFRADQLPRLIERMSLLVIDEAHCISDWGHDFRPDYRRIRDLIAELPGDVPVLATTATANSRVVADVEEQIAVGGREVLTVRGPLARSSLRLGVLRQEDAADRLAWLSQHLADLPGSGIVYCLTVSAAEDTARLLADAGHAALPYTGRTDPDSRTEYERRLKDNEVKALIATSALGMGFDKPDLGFVVHLGAPSSPVAYYQQVGRAGRATDTADVLLLPGAEDEAIWRYFATASMPTQERADQVLAALADAGSPLSVGALEARVDVRRSPLELLLKVLAVDGAAENVKGGWRATGQSWTYDAERYGRIAAARRDEQAAMLRYENLATCRMEFLAAELDDPDAAPCGRCDVCAGIWFPTDVSAAAAESAGAALHRVGVPVDPRAQWPQGLDRLGVADPDTGTPLKGKIVAEDRVEPGRVLARLSDLGWGGPLRELLRTDADGAPVDQPVPAPIGRAMIDVLAGWDWARRPAGVIAVPSAGRPQLVESLATGIAQVGRLPYLGALTLAPGARPGPSGRSSAFRVTQVWDRFTVDDELRARLAQLGGAPVLLVDDLIDSRWTMTVAGLLLRRAGSGPVLPLALAQAG